MDQSKQNLSPELKEVYDRVMNTTAKPQSTTTASVQTPQTPQTPTPVTTTPVTKTNVIVESTTPAPAAQPTTGNMPAGTTLQTPPTAFVFNGNKMTSDGKTATKTKGKMPGFLIPVGVIILVVFWAFLWAKIFGLF